MSLPKVLSQNFLFTIADEAIMIPVLKYQRLIKVPEQHQNHHLAVSRSINSNCCVLALGRKTQNIIIYLDSNACHLHLICSCGPAIMSDLCFHMRPLHGFLCFLTLTNV